MKRNQKGEVVLAAAIVYLTLAFVGLVAAGQGSSKSAQAETITVSQAE